MTQIIRLNKTDTNQPQHFHKLSADIPEPIYWELIRQAEAQGITPTEMISLFVVREAKFPFILDDTQAKAKWVS